LICAKAILVSCTNHKKKNEEVTNKKENKSTLQ